MNLETAKLRATIVALEREWSARLLSRLDGMDDDEYFWEPVPDCWSVRPDRAGRFVVEWHHPAPEPAPFTTIAARLHHLGARPWPVPSPGSVDEAIRRHFVTHHPVPDGHDNKEACATAAAAIASIRSQSEERVGYYEALSGDDLFTRLGPVAHQYADGHYYDLIVHHLDERIHHAAEVALLRDLYRVRVGLRA